MSVPEEWQRCAFVWYICDAAWLLSLVLLRLFRPLDPRFRDPGGSGLTMPSRALRGGTSTYNYVFIDTSPLCCPSSHIYPSQHSHPFITAIIYRCEAKSPPEYSTLAQPSPVPLQSAIRSPRLISHGPYLIHVLCKELFLKESPDHLPLGHCFVSRYGIPHSTNTKRGVSGTTAVRSHGNHLVCKNVSGRAAMLRRMRAKHQFAEQPRASTITCWFCIPSVPTPTPTQEYITYSALLSRSI